MNPQQGSADWNKDQPNSNTESQTGINGAGPDELDGITQQLYDGELNPAEAKAALQALMGRRTKEMLERLKADSVTHWHDGWSEGKFIRVDSIDHEIIKLNQEGHSSHDKI